MMEDGVSGAILKYDGQKKDNAATMAAFWDSWLYRSWKSDRSTKQPLADNWK